MWKKILGVALIIVGILALITPFTPGAWLVFVGLEILGIRVAFWNNIRHHMPWIKKPPGSDDSDHKPSV